MTPARGAQRRLEARIGPLLGEPEQGRRADLEPTSHKGQVAKNERMDFRILDRALNGNCELSKDEWRQSRRMLVSLVKPPQAAPVRRIPCLYNLPKVKTYFLTTVLYSIFTVKRFLQYAFSLI